MHIDQEIVYLTINGEEIATTPEHPFFTQAYGWLPAGELWVGTQVRNAEGEYGTVEVVAVVRRPQPMYNLTVAQAHTFFVGEKRWLVHNSCEDEFVGLGYLPPETAREIQGIVDDVEQPLYVVGGATYKPDFDDIDYAAYEGGPWEAYLDVDLPQVNPSSASHKPFPVNVRWGVQFDLGAIEFQPGKAPTYYPPYGRK